eukprot:Rmarinus@m.9635
MKTTIGLFLAALVASASSLPLSKASNKFLPKLSAYDGHSVIRMDLTNEKQLHWIENHVDLDLWTDRPSVGAPVDIHLTPTQLESFPFEYEVLISDLGSEVRREKLEMAQALRNRPLLAERDQYDETFGGWFEEYHSFEEIVQRLEQTAAYYGIEYIPSIGKSFEGRDMPCVQFGSDAADAKTIYMQGGIHAREWVSHPTAMYAIERFLAADAKAKAAGGVQNLTPGSVDARAARAMEHIRFFVAPQVNPDGYEFSRGGDRMWRKNRNTNGGHRCQGVDLNRNWDAHWGEGGSSHNKCSDTYMGATPFSEPETAAVRDFVNGLKAKYNGGVIAGIDFHCYGQLILRPYGWALPNKALPPNEAELAALGDQMKASIQAVEGTRYTSEHAAELYVATGGADDWFYTDLTDERISYTFELRDLGRYGFVLPADQILPNAEEVFHALLDLTDHVIASE